MVKLELTTQQAIEVRLALAQAKIHHAGRAASLKLGQATKELAQSHIDALEPILRDLDNQIFNQNKH